MGFKCGIVGLPNAGKSTIFNALTAAGAQVAPFPFSTVEPNVGVVPVPDERLEVLARIIKPKKVTPTVLTFVDIAGLVKGASRGEGLGNQFLSHIREVDAIAHVVRCFDAPGVSHPYGGPDPVRDVEVVRAELILSDLELVHRRVEKAEKLAKGGDRGAKAQLEVLKALEDLLSEGKPIRDFVREHGVSLPRDLHLITAKPYFYIANTSEGGEEWVGALRDLARREGVPLVEINGKVEGELLDLDPEEREAFREALGLKGSGLAQVVKVGYEVLDLITFFTTANLDLRAWTVERGTKAPEAAGKVHSDMQRGFIRAEVLSFEDLVRSGSEQRARELGLVRIEGREYEVRDGDILYFRFRA